MLKDEAIALLCMSKPLAKLLYLTNCSVRLSQADLKILKSVREVFDAHLLTDDGVIEAAALSMEELVLLLGAFDISHLLN